MKLRKSVFILAIPCVVILAILWLFNLSGTTYVEDIFPNALIEVSPLRLSTALADFNDFHFDITSDLCGSSKIDVLLLVGSHPNHKEIRHVFRRTWGAPRTDGRIVRVVFLFGRPDEAEVQDQLWNESVVFGDVVEGNFRDSYHNVTYRDLMGLRWTWQRCPQARFVMHADDDIAIDLGFVMDALEMKFSSQTDFVACSYLLVGTPVMRSGRYALTKEEYHDDVFPTYCNGWWYWLTPGAAKQLDFTSQRIRPYWINDVYITGTLVKELNWTHVVIDIPFSFSYEQIIEMMRNDSVTHTPVAIVTTGANGTVAMLIQEWFRKSELRREIEDCVHRCLY